MPRKKDELHGLFEPYSWCFFGLNTLRLGIGCIVAVAVKISSLHLEENHYLNREVDELDEQNLRERERDYRTQPNSRATRLSGSASPSRGRESGLYFSTLHTVNRARDRDSQFFVYIFGSISIFLGCVL